MGVLDIKRNLKRKVVEATSEERLQAERADDLSFPLEGDQDDDLIDCAEFRLSDNERWFLEHKDELPIQPFQLFQGVRAADPAKMYRWLEEDVRDPHSPRRIFGALESDLKALRQVFQDV